MKETINGLADHGALLSRHPKRAIKPKRRGRPPGRPNPIPPTPETLAKLVGKSLHTLSEDQHRAASKIDTAFQILCAHQLAHVGGLEPRIAGGKGEWGDRATALIDACGVWLDEMQRRNLPTEWVMAMIVDGMPPGEVGWRSHHRRAWAAQRLTEAPELYCRLAQRR